MTAMQQKSFTFFLMAYELEEPLAALMISSARHLVRRLISIADKSKMQTFAAAAAIVVTKHDSKIQVKKGGDEKSNKRGVKGKANKTIKNTQETLSKTLSYSITPH